MMAERLDESADDVALDREIRRLLAVELSPHFHSSVLRRIAHAPVTVHRPARWRIAAVAAAMVFAVAITFRVERPAPMPSARNAVDHALPAASPAQIRRVDDAGRDTETPSAERLNPEHTARASASHRAAPTHAPTVGAAVLLSPDETRALRALIAGVSAGRIDMTAVVKAAPPPPVMEFEPIETLAIPPIVIAPVEGVRP
jgi:hypothetical protein